MAGGVLLFSLPQMIHENFGFSTIDSFKPLFLIYILAGITVTVIYFFFSKDIEVKKTLDSKIFSSNLSSKSKKIIFKM